jgi:hypothetical protein
MHAALQHAALQQQQQQQQQSQQQQQPVQAGVQTASCAEEARWLSNNNKQLQKQQQ